VRGLKLHGVVAEAATLNHKKGVRVQPDSASNAVPSEPNMLAVIDGLRFANGVIEAEIAGTPAPVRPSQREGSSASGFA
jgi:hypothetical protein